MPAAMKGAISATVHRFRLGDFEVVCLLDGKAVRDGLTPAFGGPEKRDEVEALARANHINPVRYVHPFIPVLVNTGKQLILFDTGNGTLARDNEQMRGRLPDGRLVERMREAGYDPVDVDLVVITHGHPDHIGGLMDGDIPAFPKARYIFGATEFNFWRKGENVREARLFNRDLFMKLAVPLADLALLVHPGDEIAPGVRAIDAFGHSPGMLAYSVKSGTAKLLIWADACSHFVIAIQRPDLHLDVDDDKELAARTRSRMLELAASENTLVAGYHLPFPGLGYIEKLDDGYRWAPLTYQLDD